MTLKRSVLNSRNLGFNELNFNLFADVQARSQKFAKSGAILGAEPPALENFAFFCKNNFYFRTILKNNAFKTWHKRLAAQHDLTDCINGLCGRWLMITL